MFDWRVVVFGGLVLLVAGLGIKTVTPVPPELPVIKAFVSSPHSSAIWHFATVQCIADKMSLKGYVTNVEAISNPLTPVILDIDTEVTTLSRAKRLIHDRPSSHALDPNCVMGGYFQAKEEALLWALF